MKVAAAFSALGRSLSARGVAGTIAEAAHFAAGLGIMSSPSALRAYWYEVPGIRNAGDMLTPFLIERLSGRAPERVVGACVRPYYSVCGSILGDVNRNATVWGSGILDRDARIVRPRATLAVRGPLSGARMRELGHDCPDTYGDPAILLPRLHTPAPREQAPLGLIPHFRDYPALAARALPGVRVINMLEPVEDVLAAIASCRRTVSSSLHGIIISHAYGVPSLWARFSDQVNGDGVKFADYFLSTGAEAYSAFELSPDVFSAEDLEALLDANDVRARPREAALERLRDGLMAVCPFGTEGEYT